jgi:hypothetical protein
MALKEEQIIAVALVQLNDMGKSVEHHGIELGMLLDSLMSLVERHKREASATCVPLPGEAAEALRTQLALDHETMLHFEGPLLLARQFQDRLRQRLEHVRAILAELPASSAPCSDDVRTQIDKLFPFEEERAANAAAFHVDHTPADEPDVEMF